GSFTLVTEEWDGDTKIHTHDYQAVPTGSSTFITLALDSLSETSELRIDFDGDGSVDGVVSALTDKVVVPIVAEGEKTTEKTHSAGSRIKVRLPVGQVAGASISTDKEWYYGEMIELLKELSRLLILLGQLEYEK
ncbi:MAG: hypothetical protein ACI9BF_000950, partial [Candidatus Paceibacteria bacterium]